MSDFETKLERLETIAGELRDGSTAIDRAAALFEEGVRLARTLDKELRRMERRVEILANTSLEEDDDPAFELFPDLTAGAEQETDGSTPEK